MGGFFRGFAGGAFGSCCGPEARAPREGQGVGRRMKLFQSRGFFGRLPKVAPLAQVNLGLIDLNSGGVRSGVVVALWLYF